MATINSTDHFQRRRTSRAEQ